MTTYSFTQIFVPKISCEYYISRIAYNRLTEFELSSGFNIIKYNKYIINTFENILSENILDKFTDFYKLFYTNKSKKFNTIIF